ncbi:putative extracellular calcium-sensing receptor-like isoform 2 [Scophthalmus maximus]|uniref:Putative extracellular calcium-sensing receptor-like isoform 2 n=1 Tax=Scophthalmus maximus TaxID=52904 RepID=A0A2U9B4I9_SCOMX|nr:putative extracellular calcium-sensing receptor-like isoform 2 [Scophthalmus maximus]
MHTAILSFLAVLFLNTVSGCEQFARFDMPSLFKQGDVMIGGIFPLFNKEIRSIYTFEREPPGVKCAGFDLRAFRWTQVMIFAIEEINKESTLLPNITLGYRILNSCASPTNTLRAALTLASGPEEIKSTSTCPPAISALIAESGSSQSLAVAGTLGPFQVPIVSYFSTCACLSDRAKYPTFFRTIPSDYFQAKALAALVKRFGWQWIGAIQSDNDYGRNGILAFTEEVKKLGVCIAFVGTILRTHTMDKILDVVEMIKQSTVKVILAFIPEGDFYPLMKEVVKQNITGIQWIASEAWITAPRPSTPEIYKAFGGALGFVVQKMAIPNLKPFLTGISPHADPSGAFVRNFWEIMVGCRSVLPGEHTATEATNEMCTGNETLLYSQDMFFNVTQLRVSYNVYKAVYAIAHALHQLVFCQPAHQPAEKPLRPCLNISEIQTKQVTAHLQKVHFRNQFGDNVLFDENGDPPASYDIINWQLRDGQVQHVSLGHFASAANGDYKLSVREKEIVWRTGKMVPSSVCSNVCPVGTRKAQIKGKSTCCFDCIPCADGTIANSTGAADCTPCPREYWSSERKDACIPKTVEFLTYHEPMGIAITAEMPDLNCTYRPPPVKCNGFDPRAFRWAQTMRLAVEEINQSPELLPNYTLGYKIFDSCAYPLTGQRAALAVLNGLSEDDSPICSGASPLLAVIGESGSAQSIVVSRILQPFGIPMISYFSSCACLSDRRKYPTFFRVIPNDDYQVKAIAQLLVRFNWTWVGLLRGDHEYGRFAVQGLMRELQGTKVCVAYQEMIPLLYNHQAALEIMQVMRSSSAKVVVVFSAEGEMTPFLRDYMTQNITGIQWVASEAWVTASVFTGSEYYPYLGGTIGFGIRKGQISRLGDYLQTVNPEKYPDNVLVQELWEALYGCSPSPPSGSKMTPCSGLESLLEQHSAYMNTSSPRVAYNVYKAVYAIAHSLHNLLICQPQNGPFGNNSCAQEDNIHPWQLQHYLQEVAFNIGGEEVDFDLKGDSIPYYDIINWQRGTEGKIEFVNVGLFDGTRPAGEKLLIQENRIIWAGHRSEASCSHCVFTFIRCQLLKFCRLRWRCRCLYAVPAVFRGPGRLSVVGSLSAALTVYFVTMAKLAMRQTQ